jgi:glycosyltransferase involved in cell wall biosynthesis
MSFRDSKNLIIHDYFENFGGGERLVKVLYENKSFDIIYGFEKNNLTKVIGLNKKSLNLNSTNQPILLKKILLKKKFETLQIKKKYDTCIISGNYSIFSNLKNCRKKIFYCHSLPKIFFEFNNFYKFYDFKKIINIIYKEKFIKQYIKKLNEMDIILCNSIYTKKKIKEFTNLNAIVIFPPIETKNFKWICQKKFFVSNNRHTLGKNLISVIKVFKKFPDYNIYFTSSGPLTNHLKKFSRKNKNIIFTGFLNENEYSSLLGNCVATINISMNEDFGMAALEGLSAGKPAVVTNSGGYLETIKNGYNGFVIDKNNVEKELNFFLNNLNLQKLYKLKKNCIMTAKKYSAKNFIRKINKILKN